MGPKIASFYSSLIRGRFASSWWDLIALLKPVFVQARLLVYACVCVPVHMRSCVPGSVDSADSWSKQWSIVPEARL